MPYAQIRGLAINYEVIGDAAMSDRPWVVLSTGGRNPYGEFVDVARKIAAEGFRVLLHDRRNCGASDVGLDERESEDDHRVLDLHDLVVELGAFPAYFGGSSSGCRMSLRYYARYPEHVLGLLLLRVTGGPFPAERLPENYYGQFIRAAEQGGMAAVCATEHWKALIAARPQNGTKLMAMAPERFIAVMSRWREMFMAGVNLPAVGVSEADLHAVKVPTIVIPGNDKIHSNASGRLVHSMIPGARLHELPIEDTGAEIVWFREWTEHYDEIARVFVEFMRASAKPR